MKKGKKSLKTLILLDVSPSFRFTTQFVNALREIKTHLADLDKGKLEVHIFAKKRQKMTREDIETLIRAYVEKTTPKFDVDRIIETELGFGTHFEPIMELFRQKYYGYISKAIIYTDFGFDFL